MSVCLCIFIVVSSYKVAEPRDNFFCVWVNGLVDCCSNNTDICSVQIKRQTGEF